MEIKMKTENITIKTNSLTLIHITHSSRNGHVFNREWSLLKPSFVRTDMKLECNSTSLTTSQSIHKKNHGVIS